MISAEQFEDRWNDYAEQAQAFLPVAVVQTLLGLEHDRDQALHAARFLGYTARDVMVGHALGERPDVPERDIPHDVAAHVLSALLWLKVSRPWE